MESKLSSNAEHKGHTTFRHCGLFVLRSPVLPVETFLSLMNGEKAPSRTSGDRPAGGGLPGERDVLAGAEDALADPLVMNALLLASDDLASTSLGVLRNSTSHKSRVRALEAVARYLVRMSTRPTPFGLFAGVAMGEFGADTTARLGGTAIAEVRVRLDKEWLHSLVDEAQAEVGCERLTLMSHPMLFVHEGRIVLPTVKTGGRTADFKGVVVKATAPTRAVLERAGGGATYQEIVEHLYTRYPKVPPARIDGLVGKLWELGLLISDMKAPGTCLEPEHHVHRKLVEAGAERQARALGSVIGIRDAIPQGFHDTSSTGLNRLIEAQREINSSTTRRAVCAADVRLDLTGTRINSAIGDAAAEAASVLSRLRSSRQVLAHLREYHAEFVERYGTHTEVPLLHLLSPESGLDAPRSYTQPPREYERGTAQQRRGDDRRRAVLGGWILDAVNDGTGSVELTDARVEALTEGEDPLSEVGPMDVYLQVSAESRAALDRGDWVAALTPGTGGFGWRSVGRFIDLFSDEQVRSVESRLLEQHGGFEDTVFAELSHLPAAARAANVTGHRPFFPYEIPVNVAPGVPDDRVIELSDLVVGADLDGFYIRSRKLGKYVMATQSHMLTPRTAPNVCRFLLEVAWSYAPLPGSFDWGDFEDSVFLPRVTRGRVMLRPAQWNIGPNLFEEDGTASDEALEPQLDKWLKQWRVPRYVYLSVIDHRMVLDLDNGFCRDVLIREIRRTTDGQPVRLHEMFPDFGHLWLEDGQGRRHVAELVVPVAPAGQERRAPRRRALDMRPPDQASGTVEAPRRVPPGGRWTYLKLYVSKQQQDDFVADHLRTHAERTMAQGLADRWFYIRYVDPAPHLRLRMRAPDAGDAPSRLLTETLRWANELVEAGHLSDFSLVTYLPEIDRYGGPPAYETVEAVFTADSALSGGVLGAIQSQLITLDAADVCVVTVDRLLRAMGMDLRARIEYLAHLTEPGHEAAYFRERRKRLCTLVEPWRHERSAELLAQRDLLLPMVREAEQPYADAARRLSELAEQDRLTAAPRSVIDSLLHMHINRLMGIDRAAERRVYACLKHALLAVSRRPDPTDDEPDR